MICTGYLDCSEILLPYLLNYLHANSSDSKREHHGINKYDFSKINVFIHAVMASMCEYNLRKTIKFGGRKNPPGEDEIEAILVAN